MVGTRYSDGLGVMSSSWSSSMLSMSETADEELYVSSSRKGLLTRLGERKGLEARPTEGELSGGELNAGVRYLDD